MILFCTFWYFAKKYQKVPMRKRQNVPIRKCQKVPTRKCKEANQKCQKEPTRKCQQLLTRPRKKSKKKFQPKSTNMSLHFNSKSLALIALALFLSVSAQTERSRKVVLLFFSTLRVEDCPLVTRAPLVGRSRIIRIFRGSRQVEDLQSPSNPYRDRYSTLGGQLE